ncbi:MAG TPA: 3-methyl-2-oxobutanoate dehydrogenase (2-methylpropanoyl-transferring) subunit alpha, partial [Caulobacteraceae bacterium]|nr:3-methyl-2-oxobutanoate dehydrogenase (2-methylpropanoyl-transferring) subunit alpha [Caulobacteraceae bacterium]
SKYRPADEASAWPLGDPVARLRQHLELTGAFGDGEYDALAAACDDEVRAALKAAEAIGTLGSGDRPSPASMFEDVYHDPPWHLRQQRQQAGV